MIKINKTTWIVIAISLLYLILAVSCAYLNPPFVDEPTHTSAGLTKLRLSDYRMHTEAPPLIQMMSASPLLFLNLDLKTDSQYWINKDMPKYSYEFLYDNNHSPETIMFLARLPMIILGLILGLFIFFLVSKLYDKITALIVYLLYATHPMILANSSITYIDFGFLFFNFFAFIMLLKFIETKKEKYIYSFFIFFSLAFISKFTSLHNFILYPLILILNYKNLIGWAKKNKKKIVKYIILFAVMLYVIILVAYQFQNIFISTEQAMKNDPNIIKGDKKFEQALTLINKNQITSVLFNLPNPLPYSLTKGIGFWVFDARSKEKAFNAINSLKAIILKNTIPILLLLCLWVFIPKFSKRKEAKQKLSYELNFLYYILFYFIMFGMVGSYVLPRYLLMIYPFIVLLTAKPISVIINSKIKKKWKIAIFALLLIIHLISIFYVPNFYKYNNVLSELIGKAVNDLPLFVGG